MKKNRELGIGSHAFHKGKVVKIMASTRHQWGIVELERFSTGHVDTVRMVNKRDVEPLAHDVFELRDMVKSSHTFHGVVMGFESATNRVICVSEKKYSESNLFEMDRVRYAYKVSEIYRVGKILKPIFKPGGKYKLHYCEGDTRMVSCSRYKGHPGWLVLQDFYTEKHVGLVGDSMSECELIHVGIKYVEKCC